MNKTWLFLCLLLWAGQLVGQVRIALCPLDTESRNLADLALAELSADHDIACLERTEIDRLLAEARLADQSDFQPDLQLMQNVELFIVLQGSELQAFDATTGVRLASHKLDTATEVSQAVRQALVKRERFVNNQLRKLSLLPMTPVNLSPKQEETARKLENILSRQLGNRPDLVLLERRHLMMLLSEPGAETSDLTSQLFAGALLLKPTALQDPKGLHLRLEYFTPDGLTALLKGNYVFPHDCDLEQHMQKFLQHNPPEIAPEDKPGEARAFIYEAWFALSHSLPGDALSAAASAVALDPACEKHLCRILSQVAGEYYWKNSGKMPTMALHAGAISHLQRAARLAAKHHFFPKELGAALSRYGEIVTEAILRLLPPEVQQQWRDTVELILTTYQNDLAVYLRLADLPGIAWTDRFFSLQARAMYIHLMTKQCDKLWDYSYWERFVEPELDKYITESNELLPEMAKYQALPLAEKESFCRQTWEQERFRSFPAGKVFSLDHSYWSLAPSHITEKKMTPLVLANLAIRRRALEKLTCSRNLNLALVAHAKLAVLNLTTDPPQSINNRIAELTEEEKKVLDDFFDQAAKLLSTAICVGSPNLSSLVSYRLRLCHPNCLEQRLRLHELAIRHHACYHSWWYILIGDYNVWPKETAVRVHQQLHAYLDQYEHDPRTENHSDKQRRDVRNTYDVMLSRLEQFFDIPSRRTFALQPIDPFAKVFRLEQPKGFGFSQSPCLLGFDGRYLFLDYVELNELIQLQIDTTADMAVVRERRLPHNVPRERLGGSDSHGLMLTDHFISRHGNSIFLYAKKKPSCQVLDFSHFDRRGQGYRAMTGYGDRLFLSFGWLDDDPTTVMEYDVRQGTTKVIASSIDRSIPWPLQYEPRPIPIPHLHCDGTSRRLIMLPTQLASADKRFKGGGLQFLAYYWETGQWKNASRPLELYYGCPKTFYDQTGLWLLHGTGFGKINEQEGYWQTVFRLLGTRLIPAPQPKPGQESYYDGVDDSHCLVPTAEHRDFRTGDWRFTLYADGLLFSENVIMLVPERKFIRLDKPFNALGCLGGRYVVGHYVGKAAYRRELVIGVLKERHLLAQ